MLKPRTLFFLAVLLSISVSAARADEGTIEIYVAPNGRDTWDGQACEPVPDGTNGPVATLAGARDAIRKLKAKGPLTEQVCVLVRGGTYRMIDTLTLDAKDSGTEKSPIVWQAYPGEAVHFVGGASLIDWQPVQDNAIRERLATAALEKVVQCDLRAAGVTDLGAVAGNDGARADLICNGQYMPLAQYPNAGEWTKITNVPQDGETRFQREEIVHYGRFAYDDPRPAGWKDTTDLWVHGYWVYDWQDQYEHVQKLDVQKKEVHPEPPYHGYGYKAGQRFRFVNVLEEIDQPGEWFLDRAAGVLYFWPPDDIRSVEVAFPELRKPMIVLDGVEFVSVRGIIFECSKGGAVVIRNGRCDEIAGCTIRNVGNPAVSIQGGTGHAVRSCDIHHVASTAVELGGGDRKTLARGDHVVENCDIHHFAAIDRTYHPAVRLSGVGNRIAHCSIHDAPHQGIALEGNDHVIEFCDFARLAQETGDVGVIYSAMDWTYLGNVVRYNYFHEVHGPGNLGCFVIYPDLPCGGIHLYGNVFHDIDYVFHTNSGRGMLIENNVFSRCNGLWFQVWTDPKKFLEGGDWRMVERLAEVRYDQPPYSERYPVLRNLAADFAQGADHVVERELPKDNIVRRNVSCSSKFLAVNAPATLEHVRVENNLIADEVVFEGILAGDDKPATYRNGDPRAAAELGKRGNVIGGVGSLGDLSAQRFQFAADSQAAKLGFEPIPFDKIGLQADPYRPAADRSVAVEEPFFSPQQAAARMMQYFVAMQHAKPLEVRRGAAWLSHRDAVRKRLLHDLALDPLPARVDLDPHYSEPIDHPWCTIHKVALQVWPGVYSRGLLYMPKTFAQKPAPAMLCPHGHYPEGYTYVDEQTRAIVFAKLGYVAFATNQEHHEDILRGISCQTFMVWNNMRALDFLQSLPEVDPKRLGVCGLSGGGLQSQMLVATDPRLKAASIAGMTCQFRENLYPYGAQCGCNHWPNTTAYTDAPEISTLGFPAAVQYLVMDDWTAHFAADDFPAIQSLYRDNGYGDRAECVYWPTGHVFDRPKRERCYWWMERWVRGKPGQIQPEPSDVQTFPSKQLLDLKVDVPNERSFSDYFRGQFQRPMPAIQNVEQWGAYREKMLASLRERLGEGQIVPTRGKSSWREIKPARAEGQGVRVEEFLAAGEDHIAIPGVAIYPNGEKPPTSIEIVLSDAGRSAVAANPTMYIEAARRGAIVVAPDIRFSGDYSPRSLSGRMGPMQSPHDVAYVLSQMPKPADQVPQFAAAWLRNGITWGRPIPGMMVTDLEAVLNYLEKDRNLAPTSVQVTTRDSAAFALAAVLAACLDPRITTIDADLLGCCYEDAPSWAHSPQSLPIITGILCDGDVLQWAALLADRRVTLRHAPKSDADRRWLSDLCNVLGKSQNVTLTD